MQQAIAHIALVVRDYDEALAFYVGKLGFRVVEDKYQPEQYKRWVVISPPGASGTSLLLARASTQQQEPFIGNQAGGRVFLFLQTDDFWRDYNRIVGVGVCFVRPPSEEPYGTVAVFEDLYGTRWDLLQYNRSTPYAPGATCFAIPSVSGQLGRQGANRRSDTNADSRIRRAASHRHASE